MISRLHVTGCACTRTSVGKIADVKQEQDATPSVPLTRLKGVPWVHFSPKYSSQVSKWLSKCTRDTGPNLSLIACIAE